jgi:SNF family Na+-dependent transporter
MDNLGELLWGLFGCNTIAWALVFFCIFKGVKSSGKAVYFTSTFPYIVLAILVAFGATLDGAGEGIKYYLKPDMSKLWEGKVWAAAATQIFYSLGVSLGGLMCMASYNRFDNNILRDTLVVTTGNCFSSVFAGFGIFSFLGHMAFKNCLEVKDVVAQGPGLAFIAYPEALALMPAPQLFSVLFFAMLIMLGLGSQFALVDVGINSVVDYYPEFFQKGSRKAILVLYYCILLLLLGMPMVREGGYHVLNLMDNYSALYGLLLVSFSFSIAVFYFYNFMTKKQRFLDDIEEMIGEMSPVFTWYFKSMWYVGTPLLLLMITLYTFSNFSSIAQAFEGAYGKEVANLIYPQWTNIFALSLSFMSFVPIPIFFIYKMCCDGLEALKPTKNWGPYFKVGKRSRTNTNDTNLTI